MLVLAAFGPATHAQIYVDKNSPSGRDGSSWANAYNHLQDGLSAAGSGDQVWVAEGTYYPDESSSADTDSRSATFTLPGGAKVIGGFTGYGVAEEQSLTDRLERFQDATVTLSGEIQQDGDASNNVYHVATSRGDGSGTQLRRVRLTGGNANGMGEESVGGGLLLVDTSAEIINCYVQKNEGTRGAGIGIKGGSPTLQGLLVNENTAGKAGGGIYDYEGDATVGYTTIAHNSAANGGGTFKVSSSTTWPNSHAYGNTGGDTRSEPTNKLTVDLNTTIVGNDLYQDSDGDGLGYDDVSFHPENGTLDQLVVTAGPVSKTIDMSSGPNSVTVPRSSDIDNVYFEQRDADFINTWVMNNTDTEQAPDLRQDFQGKTGFEPVPDYQSNYDGEYTGSRSEDNNSSDWNQLVIPLSELVSSYETRVIPAQSPRPKASRIDGSRNEGWETSDNTIDEWQLHISGQGGRWKERTVNGQTRDQVKTYIVDGASDYENNASYAFDQLRDILPYPTKAPQALNSTPDVTAPDVYNMTWSEDGGSNNNSQYDERFIKASYGTFGGGNQSTAVSELYSALSGGYGTVQDRDGNIYEPNDTIFDGSGVLIKDKAAFPLRVNWSILSHSNIR